MNRSILSALVVLTPLALLCGGCLAVGQSFSLFSVTVSLLASGAGSLAIAALDRREHIKSGARPPFFAGTLRGGFGNPFDVVVAGKEPLAKAFSEIAAKGLEKKGFRTSVVETTIPDAEEAVKQKLLASEAHRSVLIGIDEWCADTYTNVGMTYQITVEVMDEKGTLLATHSITGADNGKDNLKGSVMNPAGYAKKVVPKAFAGHIEALLNNERIVEALNSGEAK